MRLRCLLAFVSLSLFLTIGCTPEGDDPAPDDMSSSVDMPSAADMPGDSSASEPPTGCTQAMVDGELDGVCHWECEDYDQDCGKPNSVPSSPDSGP